MGCLIHPGLALTFLFIEMGCIVFTYAARNEQIHVYIDRFCMTILYLQVFHTLTLTDRLSLGFKWQQVFSSLQGSSHYSDRSWQCCSFGRPISNSSSPLFKPPRTVSSAPITICITVTLMYQCFFISLAKFQVLLFLSVFFDLHSSLLGWQSPLYGRFFFLLVNYVCVLSEVFNFS